jgi:spore germination protein Q
MNFYQQPFGMPYMQGMYQQPVYPQFIYADQLNNTESDLSLTRQQSYIENILRLNLGKVATVYMNFEESQWGSKVFKGVLQAAGKDHIILKDVNSDTRYLLLTIYLCYVTFDEKIEYDYPFQNK